MKKILCSIALIAGLSARGFATIDVTTMIYVPALSHEGYQVIAVPVMESMGVPYLPLVEVLQREYPVPMVGGGSSGMCNINAMAGARISIDNAAQLQAFEAFKVSGVTVNLRSVYNSGDDSFVAAVKKAMAKTFDIDASKVKIIR
jgi:hypothetical protein